MSLVGASFARAFGSASTDSLRFFKVRAILTFSLVIKTASSALIPSNAFLAARSAYGAAAARPTRAEMEVDSTMPEPVIIPPVTVSLIT